MLKKYLNCSDCSQVNCLINKCCSEKWKVVISENKSVVSYLKGQHIFYENSIVHGMYFIYNGKVKVFNTGKNERQYILRLAGSGEMLGMRAYADKKYRVGCVTLDETTVCFIDKAVFIQGIKKNSELALALIHLYAQTFSLMDLRQKHLAQLCCKDLLAEALLIIKKHFGKVTKQGVLLDVNLSHQDIANIAGIVREEVNRALSVFKKKKIISYTTPKKIVLLKPDKLMAMVLNNYENIYQQECCEILL